MEPVQQAEGRFGRRLGAPLHSYSPAEYEAFIRLNAMSVATLTLFIGLLFSGTDGKDGSTTG